MAKAKAAEEGNFPAAGAAGGGGRRHISVTALRSQSGSRLADFPGQFSLLVRRSRSRSCFGGDLSSHQRALGKAG